jgi:hypothetical protein
VSIGRDEGRFRAPLVVRRCPLAGLSWKADDGSRTRDLRLGKPRQRKRRKTTKDDKPAFQKQIWRRGGVSVEASNSHSDYFQRNLVALRAEERLALGLYRPSSLTAVSGLT